LTHDKLFDGLEDRPAPTFWQSPLAREEKRGEKAAGRSMRIAPSIAKHGGRLVMDLRVRCGAHDDCS